MNLSKSLTETNQITNNFKIAQNGIVGHNIVIRSLPPRIHEIMRDIKSFSSAILTSDSFDYEPFFTSSLPTHHVVIRTKGNDFDDIDNQIKKFGKSYSNLIHI